VAGGRPSAGKRARERARQEKAVEKAERKTERAAEAAAAEPVEDTIGEEELVRQMRILQENLDAGMIDLEAFQDAREDLMTRYSV
jgi:hypothetical protein